MKVVWSPTAISDLSHVRSYIAEHNPAAALQISERILEAVERLVSFPAAGRPGRVPNTRELVVTGTPLVIPYLVIEREVRILAVLHAARRWPASFSKE